MVIGMVIRVGIVGGWMGRLWSGRMGIGRWDEKEMEKIDRLIDGFGCLLL